MLTVLIESLIGIVLFTAVIVSVTLKKFIDIHGGLPACLLVGLPVMLL